LRELTDVLARCADPVQRSGVLLRLGIFPGTLRQALKRYDEPGVRAFEKLRVRKHEVDALRRESSLKPEAVVVLPDQPSISVDASVISVAISARDDLSAGRFAQRGTLGGQT
jgi:hypothetical protein